MRAMGYMRRLARPFGVTMVILEFGTGCTRWAVDTAPPSAIVADQQGRHIRVSPCSGKRFELYKTQVAGDTLVGNLFGRVPVERRFPADSACQVEVRKFAALPTVLLGLGVGLVIFFAVSADDIARASAAGGI